MSKHTLQISPDGSITHLYDDALKDLQTLGPAEVRRASHVEPDGLGSWTADLSPVGGPVLGPYPLRDTALEEERKWLEAHQFGKAPPGSST